MWSSPDIRQHVKEYTDFKISKIMNFWQFNSKVQIQDQYEYVFAGEYEQLILPDISVNNLRDKLEEFIDIADRQDFTMDADFKSPHIAHLRYGNILFYQLILFVNRLSSNADFNIDKIKEVFLLTASTVNDLILSHNKRGIRTAKKIENIEEYELMLEKIKENSKEPKKKTSEWLNIKIPTYDFSEIEEHPLYNKLINDLGEDYIVKVISKLNKYKKIKKRDDDYV
jgi:hypothetical protein